MTAQALERVFDRITRAAAAAGLAPPRLLAVSKTRDAAEVAALAAAWRARDPGAAPAFGENYVQEAAAKRAALPGAGLDWHLVGHLQSNKAAQAAALFDWVQSVDRPKLVAALAAARDPAAAPLNVLLQVNIDGEAGKQGCRPDQVAALADAVAAQPRLALRGLMAIPAPAPDAATRRGAFAGMRALFDDLAARHAGIDTLSMGMSDDLEDAIAEGATLVRVGTALFGPRG